MFTVIIIANVQNPGHLECFIVAIYSDFIEFNSEDIE